MQITRLILLIGMLGILSCTSQDSTNQLIVLEEKFQNKGHELVGKMVDKVGDYQTLKSKNGIISTYTFVRPDGKSEVSTEKYLFTEQLSYGKLHKHDYTFPELEGVVEQGYDGDQIWMKHNGALVSDTSLLAKAEFNRSTNLYWFTLLQKLLDPDLFYDHIRVESIEDATYDVVLVRLDIEGVKSTNTYELYINQETLLVDQLIYDSEDLPQESRPRLIQMSYEAVDGILLPTKRRYIRSTWKKGMAADKWTYEEWSDVSFETTLSATDFKMISE